MSKRAEQAALKEYPPSYSKVNRNAKRIQSYKVDTHKPIRQIYIKGYEQAEKDTIERVVSWLIKNVDYYIGSMEFSRCLPIKYHVSCACWADLKAFIEEE